MFASQRLLTMRYDENAPVRTPQYDRPSRYGSGRGNPGRGSPGRGTSGRGSRSRGNTARGSGRYGNSGRSTSRGRYGNSGRDAESWQQRGSGFVRAENDAAAVDAQLVEDLLTEREQLRKERRYDDADALRDELDAMGVMVWDRDRVWSATNAPPPRNEVARAGERSRDNNFYRSAQRFGARSLDGTFDDEYARDGRPRSKSKARHLNEHGHDYQRSENDQKRLDAAHVADVHEMLRERLEAKLARDFDEADALLAQLQQEFGVTVNDGSKEWRADGQSFARHYQRVGALEPWVDEAAVQQLIAERTAARKARNYHRADGILAELLETHGVALVDSSYSWRVVGSSHDGEYGEGGGYGRRAVADPAAGHDYMREPGDTAPIEPELHDKIDDLLAQRLAKKKSRCFDEADALQDQLWELGVEVDDRARTWYYEPA